MEVEAALPAHDAEIVRERTGRVRSRYALGFDDGLAAACLARRHDVFQTLIRTWSDVEMQLDAGGPARQLIRTRATGARRVLDGSLLEGIAHHLQRLVVRPVRVRCDRPFGRRRVRAV